MTMKDKDLLKLLKRTVRIRKDIFMKLLYPAIFHQEEDGFWVEFPDFDGCYSQGDTIEETYENAKEALQGYCLSILDKGKTLSSATHLPDVKLLKNTFTSLVETNINLNDKFINKTLKITTLLNDET